MMKISGVLIEKNPLFWVCSYCQGKRYKCVKFLLFSKEISFSLENSGRISGVRSSRIAGVRSGRISFSLENSGGISGVRSGRMSRVRSGRISGVGRHRVPLTISVSIVESLMLIGMAVDSIVPRFRTGFSISLTISFSFTFHNMHSTTGVGIIPEFEIKISLPYRHTNEYQNSIKGNIHTCCNCMVAWNGHCMVVEQI